MQTKNNTTKRKRQTKTDETVETPVLIADANRIGGARLVDSYYESLGFLKGDLALYDRFIEPVIGEPAIYTKKIKGETTFGMFPFSSKKPRGWKYEGMVTHYIRCIYKSAYDILGAEFITSEVSE